MNLSIPFASGLDAVVKRQLEKLGYAQTKAENGRISLCGDWSDVARLNVFLRSGERVLIVLGKQKCETFDELFDFVYSLPWEDYLDSRSLIRIEGKSVKSKLGAIKASGGVAKKAIVKRLCEKLSLTGATLAEDGARTIVGISLYEDMLTVSIDTSGEGLHKRGYRSLAYTAPLKETLAAAMIDLSVYHADKAFADLFCGSGTLPIEAAMKSLRIAPGKNRDFDFTAWRCAPQGVLLRAREEAADTEERQKTLDIFAADIDPNAVSIAKYHAKRAGVEKSIRFACADMRKFQTDTRYGVIVSNPPYGERMGEIAKIRSLYADLGKLYKSLPDWSIYILTSCPEFEKFFGMRTDKNRLKKLFNANLECGFYQYLGKKPPKA